MPRGKPHPKEGQCLSSVTVKEQVGPKESGPAVGSATSVLLLLAPNL